MTCAPGSSVVTEPCGTCARVAARTRSIAVSSAGAHVGGQCAHGLGDLGSVDADGGRPHPIQPLGLIEQRNLAADAHVVDEFACDLGRHRDIRRGARHDRGESGAVEHEVAEVDGPEHGAQVYLLERLEAHGPRSAFRRAYA